MFSILLILFAFAVSGEPEEPPLAHRAHVTIDPATAEISVVDTLHGVALARQVSFALNRSLDVAPIPGVTITDPDTAVSWDIPAEVARVVRLESHGPCLPEPLVVRYRGRLRHDFQGRGSYARGFETTAGIIDSLGVFLSGSSFWLPTIPDRMITFELVVSLPTGWTSVSEGVPSRDGAAVTWRCEHPMEEAHLIAGRFSLFEQPCGEIVAQAYFLSPDSALAGTYLDATCRYLALYDSLIGPYAHEKFALVENFWQTGYGMPSFTLLGSQVIRLPFIVHTSYGHEILHNWFGNGIYVDYEHGNWCEGLTAYLADHYYKELAGEDRDWRLRQLQNYAWYAAGTADLPLTAFRERDSSASEAVGYGKSAMVFHMLRRELRDEAFFAGVRELYRTNLFKRTTWSDLAAAFSLAAAQPLDRFFTQWTTRIGCPSLSLDSAEPASDGLHLVLSQTAPSYDLKVPVVVTVGEGDSSRTHEFSLPLTVLSLDTVLAVSGPIRRVAVDPEYDLFRLLSPGESPPCIGSILGADSVAVLSGSYDSLICGAWPTEGEIRIVQSPAQATGSMMIAGDGPEVWAVVAPFFVGDLICATDVLIAGADTIPATQTVIAVGQKGDHTLCWIRPGVGADPASLRAVMAKAVHYGSVSLLAFDGSRAALKKTWPVRHNPMVVDFPPQEASR